MKEYYYLGYTQVLSIKGEEVLEKNGWRKKKVIKTDVGYYTGRYYDTFDKAVEALLKVLEKRKATQKNAVRKATAEYDETVRLLKHWQTELNKGETK